MRRSQGNYRGGGLSESSCALPRRLAMERGGVLPAAPDQVWWLPTGRYRWPAACAHRLPCCKADLPKGCWMHGQRCSIQTGHS